MKFDLKSARFPVVAMLLAAAASDLPAQTAWISPASGQWAEAANWSAGLPDGGLAAAITNAGQKVVVVDPAALAPNRTARRLDLHAPSGFTNTLRFQDLGAAPFRLVNSVNLDAGGRIEILDSALSIDGGQGGGFNQFAGDLILSSGGIIAANGARMRIGRTGAARALVAGGALTAQADLIVGGGTGSNGYLTLSNGVVRVDGELNVADDPGSIGSVIVAGGTFAAANPANTSRVGDDGDGAFSILGGLVTLNGLSVGRASGSTGRLEVRGGTLRTGSLSAGRFAGAQGRVEVAGGLVELPDNTLYAGREGAGEVVISGGAVIAGAVNIAPSGSASGQLRLLGGELITGRLIATNPAGRIQLSAGWLQTRSTDIANGAAFVIGDGIRPATLHLDGGAHAFADGLTISSNATLTGAGAVDGLITVLPGGRNQLGGISPASPVVLTPLAGGGPFRFSFPAALGKTYEVLAATNLAQTAWQPRITMEGNGAALIFTNAAPGPSRFFRVLAR